MFFSLNVYTKFILYNSVSIHKIIIYLAIILEALTTPIPPSQNRNSHHDEVGVNQAYRTDKEDIHETNHDSWDESEHETISQLPLTHEHEKGKEVERNRKHETDFQPSALDLVEHHSHIGNTQFEDCCLIQVSHGAHNDRLNNCCFKFAIAVTKYYVFWLKQSFILHMFVGINLLSFMEAKITFILEKMIQELLLQKLQRS